MGGNANDVIDRVAARQESRREIQNARNSHIRLESGELDDNQRIIAFLYILVRDHIPPGILEEILTNHVLVHDEDDIVEYTNGWLLEYVRDVAKVVCP